MEIEEYAKQSLLSRKILYWMVKHKMVNNPLSTDDLSGLQLLEKTWGKHEILRSQLSRYSRDRRLRLLENSEFGTKWERYAYGRFCNLPKGQRLPMKQLIWEVESTFGFTLTFHEIKRLYKVREKAYNRRKCLVKRNGKTV